MAQDLGGPDHLTEAMLQLIRSAAGLIVLREELDSKAANGEQVSVVEYCRISNSLRRLLATIGLERRSKDVTPHPLEYAKSRVIDVDVDEVEEVE